MIEKELYIDVLEYLQDGGNWSQKLEIVEINSYKEIGNFIINDMLEKIPHTDNMKIKQIVCMYLNYSQEQYSKLHYDDLCVLICEKVIRFKTYPTDEYQKILHNYSEIKNKYLGVITEIENEENCINELIKIDEAHPQLCGSLIKKQNTIRSYSKSNKSILKDLKKIEDEYNVLYDLIQENYVYCEMLKYAKSKLVTRFQETILGESEENVLPSLRKMAVELAKEDNEKIKNYRRDFVDDNTYLESWKNAVQSIYKPFFMIKMRKFIDDIEAFYYQKCNSTYWNRAEELIELCKQRREKILSSDQWISLKNGNQQCYIQELKKCVTEYQVVDYIKQKIDSMYCLQNRKQILHTIIDLFENQKYLLFMNLVVIQIEGLFNDMFLDANIQNRLDGQFDLFEKDDLRRKLDKNSTIMEIEEAVLYFKFYFNNLIRNKVAHGRNCFKEDEYEKVAFELLLDLQYVIHLFGMYSDTNEAVEYVDNTVRWLKFSFNGECSKEQVYEKLLNTLNGNVIKHRMNFIGYVNSHQELYWIFNPYYDEAYIYAGVVEQRNKLREYLTEENFWRFVLNYVQTYNEHEIHHIKLNQEFKSRIRALQEYIAKNKTALLPLVNDVRMAIDKVL